MTVIQFPTEKKLTDEQPTTTEPEVNPLAQAMQAAAKRREKIALQRKKSNTSIASGLRRTGKRI